MWQAVLDVDKPLVVDADALNLLAAQPSSRADWVLPPHPGGLRLDQALSLALPQYSRSRLAAWIRSGSVRLEGRAARPLLARGTLR